MSKKIIVAGAGHGGIVAGALLAEKGYDVTVYEKKVRDELGYDWFDAVDLHAFSQVGLPVPEEGTFERNGDMLFYNPALSAPLKVPANGNGSAKIERKKIYDDLIDFAQERGVKFIFNTVILGPVMQGLRVVGIDTVDGPVLGDLVIDAAGIDSPVRKNLPVCCNVDRDYGYGDSLYAYRAYFDKVPGHVPECDYEVFLVPNGEKGISWVVTEEDCVDVLIGRMKPLSKTEIEEELEGMREFSPQIGRKLLRGGQICNIPIRSALPVMVCDGYAAVGDSAYMTIPMNGSGICAALRAGKILATTVLADIDNVFSAKTLWDYNVKYIKHFGAGFASIDILKNVMISLPVDGIDYLFDKQIITENDLNFGRDKGSGISVSSVVSRATKGMGNLPVLLRTASALTKGDAAKKAYLAIPEEYDEQKVLEWKKQVESALVPMAR